MFERCLNVDLFVVKGFRINSVFLCLFSRAQPVKRFHATKY